jgi:predicted dehydrogenase
MERGLHVLCEKPMATTLGGADAILKACQTNNVKLMVIFQNRYSDGGRYSSSCP